MANNKDREREILAWRAANVPAKAAPQPDISALLQVIGNQSQVPTPTTNPNANALASILAAITAGNAAAPPPPNPQQPPFNLQAALAGIQGVTSMAPTAPFPAASLPFAPVGPPPVQSDHGNFHNQASDPALSFMHNDRKRQLEMAEDRSRKPHSKKARGGR